MASLQNCEMQRNKYKRDVALTGEKNRCDESSPTMYLDYMRLTGLHKVKPLPWTRMLMPIHHSPPRMRKNTGRNHHHILSAPSTSAATGISAWIGTSGQGQSQSGEGTSHLHVQLLESMVEQASDIRRSVQCDLETR
ncbi:uncharacterized protein LOC144495918 [Mustelus asterias]